MQPLKLPAVVWDLLLPLLDAQDVPAARLTCRDLAAALDAHSSTAIHSIRISSWHPSTLHTPSSLQHSIQHLEATISSAQDWSQMLLFLQKLPQLHTLRCSGRRTWPPHVSHDGNSSSSSSSKRHTTPHPQLRAARFDGFLTSLLELSELAPALECLECSTLVLQAHGMSSTTTSHASSSSGGSGSMSATGSLAGCTSFGADFVSIQAADEAEAGQTFAAALPHLQVLTDTPAFTWSVPAGFSMRRRVLPLCTALGSCSSLQSLRTFGSSTAAGGLLPAQLAGLQHLQCLSVYGVGPACELQGISRLTKLTQLTLTFQLPDKRWGMKLLDQIKRLPTLQQLALPAKLLCKRCCPGGRGHMQGLLGRRPAAAAAGSSGSSGGSNRSSGSKSSTGCFPQLQQLVFLHRAKSTDMWYQCGDFCQHCSKEQLQYRATLLAQGPNGSNLQVGTAGEPASAVPAVTAAPVTSAATGVDRLVAPAVPAALEAAVQLGSFGTITAQHEQPQSPVCHQQEGGAPSAAVLQVAVAPLGCKPVRLGTHPSTSGGVLRLDLRACLKPLAWYE